MKCIYKFPTVSRQILAVYEAADPTSPEKTLKTALKLAWQYLPIQFYYF